MDRIKQSKKMSAAESITNCVIGVIVSYFFTFYGLRAFGISPDASQSFYITACYFFLSLVRSYIVRRAFNAIQ